MSEELTALAMARLDYAEEATIRNARAWVNLAWKLYREGVVEWDAVKAAREGTSEVLAG